MIALPIDTSANMSETEFLLFHYDIIKLQRREHNTSNMRRVRAIHKMIKAHGLLSNYEAIKDHVFRNDPFHMPVDNATWKKMTKLAAKRNKNKTPKGNHVGRQRHHTYTVDEVKEAANNNKLWWNGRKVSLRRIHILHQIGFQCQHCERVGTIWHLEEDNGKQLHLDLFSEDNVMMTIDHIVPKSKGGPNTVDNYQCLCKICNETKGNKHSR